MNNLEMFSFVFPADGYDKSTELLNRNPHTSEAQVESFKASRLTQAAVFFGLPHRLLHPAKQQSVSNLVKNFFGWRDTVSIFKNIITMPFMTVMNIVLTPLKLLINILKLVTEFIPLYFEQNISDSSDYFKEAAEARDGVTKASLYILSGILYVGSLPFSIAYILGRAITSPNMSARIAKEYGNVIGNQLMNQNPNVNGNQFMNQNPEVTNTVLGTILGFVAASISLSISVTLYALIMPLGLQFVGAKVLPHLPGAISSFIDGAGSALAPFFNVMAKITQFLTFDVSAVAVASYSNAAIAIAGMTAISTTLLGYQTRELSTRFKVWWHSSSIENHVIPKVNASANEGYSSQAKEGLNHEVDSYSTDQMNRVLQNLQRSSAQQQHANISPVESPTSSPKGYGPDVAFSKGGQPAPSALRKRSVFQAETQGGFGKFEQLATAGYRM